MKSVDVIIVGAGVAGLYAASLLEQHGVTYRIFEASERIGGRLLSSPADADGGCVDLGAAWFWPHQTKVQAVLDALAIERFPQYVQGAVLYQVDTNNPPQRFDGEAGLSYRISGGTAAIPEQLATRINPENLYLNHPLAQLRRADESWQATFTHNGQSTQQTAKHLVLAAPPRVLLQHTNLAELLSTQLQQALSRQQTWMAAQAKFVATYKTAFWRNAGLSGDAFSRVGPMTEVHDASADDDAGYALFGFIGVPAEQRSQLSEAQLIQYCQQQLAHLFGEQALHPTDRYLKDWAKDKWICSDLDIGEPRQHPEINLTAHTKELTNLNLHFASTEVARQEAGYIEGALIAAKQAVQDIMSDDSNLRHQQS